MPYRETLMDRLGDRAPDALKAAAWATPISLLFGLIAFTEYSHKGFMVASAVGFFTVVLVFLFIAGGALLLSGGAGTATAAVMQHSGSGTPSVADYSLEKAMVMRGELDQALHSYERHIAERPDDPAPHLLAADLYIRQGKHDRAHALLEAARRSPRAKEADLMHATNRLIDLYLGPMDRP